MKNKKIWAILVHLSMHQWVQYGDALHFEDDFWDYIIKESQNAGINTIVLDLGDAVQYMSHPEISAKDAWSHKRVRDEIKKCRDMGIALIPKLNFATTHSYWLGEYRNMTSSSIYYKVCADLIKEVFELFDHPEYIHIGMDEEDARHSKEDELAIYRQGKLYWHDIRFLADCVCDTGAKPWMWSCPLFSHPEEFGEHFDADEVVLSPWYYNAFRKENWTPVESRAEYVAYYNEGDYAKLGIKFVEEDPFLVNFRKVALPLMDRGYNYIPCASVFNRCDYNTSDLLEYFKDNAPDEQVLGFMTAPWFTTEWENKKYFDESFKFFKEAKEKFYPED